MTKIKLNLAPYDCHTRLKLREAYVGVGDSATLELDLETGKSYVWIVDPEGKVLHCEALHVDWSTMAMDGFSVERFTPANLERLRAKLAELRQAWVDNTLVDALGISK